MRPTNLLCWAASLACLSSATAATVGQAWADSRLERHLGPASVAFQHGRDVTLLTDAGVVAGQSLRTGNVTWRYVAPEDESLLDVLPAGDLSVTVSYVASEVIVRGRDRAGAIVWQRTQASPSAWPLLSAAAGPLLAAQGDRVAVSLGNSVSVLEAASGAVVRSVPVPAGQAAVSLGWAPAGAGGGSSSSAVWVAAVPTRAGDADASRPSTASATVLTLPPDGTSTRSTSVAFKAPVLASSIAVVVTAGSANTASLLAVAADGSAVHAAGLAPGATVVEATAKLLQDLVPGVKEGDAVIASSVLRDTSGSPSSCEFAVLGLHLASGKDLYVKAVASPASVEAAEEADFTLLKVLYSTSTPSPASVSTINGKTYLSVATTGAAGDSSRVRVVDGAGEVVQDLTLPSTGATAHGSMWRLFAFPFAKAEAASVSASGSTLAATSSHSALGWRALAVYSDGYTVASQGGAALWAADEGAACAVQGLILDVTSGKGSSSSGSSAGDKADGDADWALSLPGRLALQTKALRATVTHAVEAATHAAQAVAADPAGTLKSMIGLEGHGSGRRAGSMAPLVSTGVDHVIVSRSRVDGGWHGCGRSAAAAGRGRGPAGAIGALTAKAAETGEVLWSLALPLGQGAGVHATSLADPTQWLTTLVATRHRPIRSHSSEVLVVESGPLHGQDGKYGVWVSTVNVATGALTGSAHYVSTSPFDRMARTPVVHTASQRAVHLLVHEDGHAVAVPGPADVQSALAGLGPDFVVASPSYDPAADVEGLTGLTLAGGKAAFKQAGAPSGWNAAGAASSSLPLAFARLLPVWSHQLAHGSAGERILALHLAGGESPVLSTRPASGGQGKKGADQDLLERAAAMDDVEGGDIRSALASGAGPHAPVSPVVVIGDDSLLLKYSLARTVGVAVGQPSTAAALRSEFERAREAARVRARRAAGLPPAAAATAAPSSSSASTSAPFAGNLTIHIVSVASGRILHSRKTEGGRGPVGLVISDNWAAYTYWNGARARPEIGVLSTYEGALDRTALTPWSSSAAAAAARSAPSTYSSHTVALPVVIHRAFLLPTSVKAGALSFTRTHLGISSPFLLLGTAGEGVMYLDRKLVDPRRPNPEAAKESDKVEGLVPYAPALPFRHNWLLTHGDHVSRLHTLSSAPTGLESTSLVLGLGVDTFVARAAPARAWDALDRDFNGRLFLAMLGALGLVTLALGRMVKAKALADAWK